jgi:hypothetical protein
MVTGIMTVTRLVIRYKCVVTLARTKKGTTDDNKKESVRQNHKSMMHNSPLSGIASLRSCVETHPRVSVRLLVRSSTGGHIQQFTNG